MRYAGEGDADESNARSKSKEAQAGGGERSEPFKPRATQPAKAGDIIAMEGGGGGGRFGYF